MKSTLGFHQLRPPPKIEEDLEWFFNRAESDMGARSNFPGNPQISPEDAVEACHRYRRIRRWLTTIADSDAGVLQSAYELRPWPVVLYDALGRLTGVVVRIACALDYWPEDRWSQEAIEMARAAWLAAQSLSPANTTFVRLRRYAAARLSRAHAAYVTLARSIK